MLSVSQALTQLLNSASLVSPSETINTLDALGRVLAADVVSSINVPSADNTQMDGYAVHTQDCGSGSTTLRVAQRIPAGHVGTPLIPGTAARIFTGSMIPSGADAVVMQEQCVKSQTAEGEFVTLTHMPHSGEWIRRAGEDVQQGQVVLSAGTRLNAAQIGLAASVGCAQLSVVRPLKVAVFFTGDELTLPGEPLQPGAIYNSNRYTLRALLQGLGCVVTDFGIVPDTLAATRDTLCRAAQAHDLIVTSGGVSVGEEDHIKPAVEAEGSLNLWQIAIKPGKPLAFGHVRKSARSAHYSASEHGTASSQEAYFMGLPGNPVSSFVTFCLFVRPFILRCMGVQNVQPQAIELRADFEWNKQDKRQEYLRVRVNTEGGLDLFPNQSSGVLTSCAWGSGLVENLAGHTIVRGQNVRYIPFEQLLS